MNIILITARPEFWAPLLSDLQKQGCAAQSVNHPDEAASLLRADKQKNFLWALLDLPHNFDSLRAAARKLSALRPDLQLAATSALSPADFSEAAAGLRFFPLPLHPEPDDLRRLLNGPGNRNN